MNGELHLISSLTKESENYSFKDSSTMQRIRFSLPEVSGWNNDLEHFPSTSTINKIVQLRKQSNCITESPSKSNKALLIPEPKLNYKPDPPPKVLPSTSPTLSNIGKIYLNDKQIFRKSKNFTKNKSKQHLPAIAKNNFSSVFLKKKKSILKNDKKLALVASINDVLSLLKPGLKNPITTIVTPQLRSKSELYKLFSKKKNQKNLEFTFFNTLSHNLNKNNKPLL
ncbi:hypothetical protein SteCoe_21053 [Stentor coeruleus]|uniref:Uncharacterized protein n=1 Tax=Stentor coeruleus TaxID=5963 RepID=A0A1R2BQE9_9CILI|nr:hypothetical protein SteCoe_21053 [Stentor coeruleus]